MAVKGDKRLLFDSEGRWLDTLRACLLYVLNSQKALSPWRQVLPMMSVLGVVLMKCLRVRNRYTPAISFRLRCWRNPQNLSSSVCLRVSLSTSFHSPINSWVDMHRNILFVGNSILRWFFSSFASEAGGKKVWMNLSVRVLNVSDLCPLPPVGRKSWTCPIPPQIPLSQYSKNSFLLPLRAQASRRSENNRTVHESHASLASFWFCLLTFSMDGRDVTPAYIPHYH